MIHQKLAKCLDRDRPKIRGMCCNNCGGAERIRRDYRLVTTAVKPGIYGLAFEIGEMFFTDNLEMVGQVSMIFSADPHKILILIKW